MHVGKADAETHVSGGYTLHDMALSCKDLHEGVRCHLTVARGFTWALHVPAMHIL
jgi:hypothetical protein